MAHFLPTLPDNITLCNSLCLSSLGVLDDLHGFDPTSTKEEDVQMFRRCVSEYQRSAGVQCPCDGGRGGGVLCSHTIAAIREDVKLL